MSKKQAKHCSQDDRRTSHGSTLHPAKLSVLTVQTKQNHMQHVSNAFIKKEVTEVRTDTNLPSGGVSVRNIRLHFLLLTDLNENV